MMNAMRDDPVDRAAFECEQAAKCKKVFHRFRCFITTMRQQSMKAHADAQAARDPPQQDRHWPDFPANHEKRSERAGMKNDHEDGCVPLNGAAFLSFALVTIHQIS